jgi:hypothetical protein
MFDINVKIHGTSATQAASRAGRSGQYAAGEIETSARRTGVALFDRNANFLVAKAENISISF